MRIDERYHRIVVAGDSLVTMGMPDAGATGVDLESNRRAVADVARHRYG
jgi:hypothetical protein